VGTNMAHYTGTWEYAERTCLEISKEFL
jgi:hypothetical protein